MSRIYIDLLLLLYVLHVKSDQHKLEVLTKPVELGEGTFWDADQQRLYFVDITSSTLNVFDPETSQHNTSQPISGDGKVSFIIPVKNKPNWFVISTGREIRLVKWDEQQGTQISSSKVILQADQETGSRFNDAKVDFNGILWAGTMGPEPIPTKVQRVNSKLFTADFKQQKLIPRVENIYISNGLEWNRQNSLMYWTDTGENTIEAFDYDLNNPNIITNRRRIYSFDEHQVAGKTDGFTMDTNGNLYLACYGGYQVIVVNPKTKQIIDTIKIPAGEVTTLSFGGPNLNDLYIATSRKGSNNTNLEQFPHTGALFRVSNYKASGYPGNHVPNAHLFQ